MKIFFIGIGGIAMGNLACLLKSQGHTVAGSDKDIYPPMSDKLREYEMDIRLGFSAENVKEFDLVIIGNAISRGNPEVEEVLNSGISYMSMSQAVKEFLLKNKYPIVIAGTHGKTTTTFLLYHILKSLGLSPGLFAGGISKDGNMGFDPGSGKYFVIEGDEYDTAFFDKSSKFLHYSPFHLVLTSLEYDHADIFNSLDEILTQFKRLIQLVPSKGSIHWWKGSDNLKSITNKVQFTNVKSYELNSKSSILSFRKGKLTAGKQPVQSSLIGMHNYRNAEAALQVVKEISPSLLPDALEALTTFPGVKRRQEIIGESVNTVIIEDFAHHPTAIFETIQAVRFAYPGYRIISLFEPRSATSHRNIFQKEFSSSFKGSDFVYICEVFNPKKVPSSIRLDVKKLVKDTQKNSKTLAYYCKNPEYILRQMKDRIIELKNTKKIVLAMSNGSFGGIYTAMIGMIKKIESE